MEQTFEELTSNLKELSRSIDTVWLKSILQNNKATLWGYLPGGFMYYIPLSENYVMLLYRRSRSFKVEFGLFHEEGNKKECSILSYENPEIQKFQTKIFQSLYGIKKDLESCNSSSKYEPVVKTPLTKKKEGKIITVDRAIRRTIQQDGTNLSDLYMPLLYELADKFQSETVRVRSIDIHNELKKKGKHIPKTTTYEFLSKIPVLRKDPDKSNQFTTTKTELKDYMKQLKNGASYQKENS